MNIYRALVKLMPESNTWLDEYIAADTDAKALAAFRAKGFVVLTLWRMVNIEST